jgi:hemerythrin-like domain-containing protein
MSIPITLPGMHTPAAGFDEPFAVLAGCHARVSRTLALLQRLVDRVTAAGTDSMAQAAASDVLRYFNLAAPAHHEDEERHVLPLLRDSGDPALAAVAARLSSDHQAIRATWDDLRPLLAALADGRQGADVRALNAAAQHFVQAHAGHLELEDMVAFPAAARLHPAPAEMGLDMARRRGVAWPAAAGPG